MAIHLSCSRLSKSPLWILQKTLSEEPGRGEYLGIKVPSNKILSEGREYVDGVTIRLEDDHAVPGGATIT
jgi:hypothetical protein